MDSAATIPAAVGTVEDRSYSLPVPARRFLTITLRFTNNRPDETYRVAAVGLEHDVLQLTNTGR